MKVNLSNQAQYMGTLTTNSATSWQNLSFVPFKGKEDKDTVEFSTKKKAQPEKLQIFKNLCKGFTQTIVDIGKTLIQSPIATLLIFAATAAAIRSSKLIGSLVTIGIFSHGLFKTSTGTARTIKAIKTEKAKDDDDDRNYKKANAEIRNIGEGLFDIALTANSVIDSVKSISNSVKTIAATKNSNSVQKMYSLFQQYETTDAVSNAPKTVEQAISRFKGTLKTEFSKIFNFKKPADTNKQAQIIDQMTKMMDDSKLTVEDVTKGLGDIRDTFKNNSSITGRIDSITSQIKNAGITKLTSAQVEEIKGLISSIESLEEIPAGVKALRSILKSETEIEDAQKFIAKYGKQLVSKSQEATKVAVTSFEEVTDEQ